MRLIDADALPKYTGYALSADEVARAVETAPTIEAIPLEWIEKQKAGCVYGSISWIALEALLKTWREEKDEVEE